MLRKAGRPKLGVAADVTALRLELALRYNRKQGEVAQEDAMVR